MTELAITPKISDKTAKFKGTIAAGEHVAVTIEGGAGWSDEGLQLRVVDLTTRRTLAVFPRPAETLDEGEQEDEWGTDGGDLTCTLNLNTVEMVAAARHMLRVPTLFVLGNPAADKRTLYFMGQQPVEYWPERIGDTAPYSLDGWPAQIAAWEEQIAAWSAQVAGFSAGLSGHANNSEIHVTATDKAAWSAKYDLPATGIPKGSLSLEVRTSLGKANSALQSHQDISGKADKSDTYTKAQVNEKIAAGAASAVAGIVANAPATFDTLKEIADWIVDDQSGAAALAADVAAAKDKLAGIEDGANNYTLPKASTTTLGGVKVGANLFIGADGTLNATSGGASVTVDAALDGTSENPVQNKVVTAALDEKVDKAEVEAGFTGWTVYRNGVDVTAQVGAMPQWDDELLAWDITNSHIVGDGTFDPQGFPSEEDAETVTWSCSPANWDGESPLVEYSATRIKLRPTKTSDLMNDSGFLTQHQDISGKENASNKVTSISAASTDAQYPSAKCVWDNLRYSLVSVTPTVSSGAAAATLNDRAVNAVDLSAEQSAVTSIAFTAPAAVSGKARDFIVRVKLPAQSDAPQWSIERTGETIDLENADGELPALTADASAAATTLLYFTETAASTFLVKGEAAKEVA